VIRPKWLPGATAYLAADTELFLTDLVVAETVCVLVSFYESPREKIAEAIRSLLALGSIVSIDKVLLLRAIEVYEVDRLDFAEACLVACAESTGINQVASFDRSIDRMVDHRTSGTFGVANAKYLRWRALSHVISQTEIVRRLGKYQSATPRLKVVRLKVFSRNDRNRQTATGPLNFVAIVTTFLIHSIIQR
jgi:predicted nucleic-acid-binding protein